MHSDNLHVSFTNNHHVHDGYGKDIASSSEVNYTDEDTDEDESNNSIAHDHFDEPSSENLVMDVSESECNIVNETLLQSDSSQVTTELNYDDHINLQQMSKKQVNLTYSSAEGTF